MNDAFVWITPVLEDAASAPFEQYMFIVWLGILIIAVIIELATTELLSVWFAGGAILALIVSLIPGAPFWSEIIVFAIGSLILLLLIRPFAKKRLMKDKPDIRFNVDDMIGKKATVTKRITELERGEILYHGVLWTAESKDGKTLEKDSIVVILGIEGNKVLVGKAPEDNKEE